MNPFFISKSIQYDYPYLLIVIINQRKDQKFIDLLIILLMENQNY